MENQQQSSDKRIWDVGNIIGCYKNNKNNIITKI